MTVGTVNGDLCCCRNKHFDDDCAIVTENDDNGNGGDDDKVYKCPYLNKVDSDFSDTEIDYLQLIDIFYQVPNQDSPVMKALDSAVSEFIESPV